MSGVEPAQTYRLGPITGCRDDVPGTKGRRPAPEIIEGRGAAALDLRGGPGNVQQRRREQCGREADAIHFSVMTITVPLSPAVRR